MTLGERIRQSRLEARLSQEKVAELVGVSRQAVTKWETNQSAPSTDNLFRLAEILGTTVDFLASSEEKEAATIAEQVYQLYKADQEKKQRLRLRRIRGNVWVFLGILGGFLAVFLAGRIICGREPGMTFKYWLFNTSPYTTTYLYGWLLSSNMFLYASLLSSVPALFGKRWYSLVSMLGFMIALLVGEFAGRNPHCGWQHWGWAIWLVMYLLFCLLGGGFQLLRKKQVPLKTWPYWVWWIAAALVVILVPLCFRLGMRPCP